MSAVRNRSVTGIFERFDEDHSGFLERDELMKLMFSVSQGDVIPLAADDPAAEAARRLRYKLQCLDELHAKGVIDADSLRAKRDRVQQRNHALVSPRVREHDPTPAEVDFVLQQADANGDNKIARDECLAALGLWLQILKDDHAEDKGHERDAPTPVCAIS